MSEQIFKIETFVPEEALDQIRNELKKINIGKIGNYVHCMSWWKARSSWTPTEGAAPYRGVIGHEEIATEYVLTFRCQKELVSDVIRIIKENHPYEEVCINIIPIYDGMDSM